MVRGKALGCALLLCVSHIMWWCRRVAAIQPVSFVWSSPRFIGDRRPLSRIVAYSVRESTSRPKPAAAGLRWLRVFHAALTKPAAVTLLATVYTQAAATAGTALADLLTAADAGFRNHALGSAGLDNHCDQLIQLILQGSSLLRRARRYML